MKAIYNAAQLIFAGPRLNKLIDTAVETSKTLQHLVLAQQTDLGLIKQHSSALNIVHVLKSALPESRLVKLQHYAVSEGIPHHMSSLFGSNHEPISSAVLKDPFGILMVSTGKQQIHACMHNSDKINE